MALAPSRVEHQVALRSQVAPAQLRLRRKVRVLFINDTARNGGPGRSLFYILKFLDPALFHRAVVLPRAGVIGDLLSTVADDLFYESCLVENPVEPVSRAMVRRDFEAPRFLRGLRLAANIGRGALAIARLTSLAKRGKFDLLYCNGTNADFAGAALARTSGIPALWHVRYGSVPRALRRVHDRFAASRGIKRIVCVSETAGGLFSHCREKVSVIHNAVDVNEFAVKSVKPCLRSELGVGAETVIFGSQGRILRRKGYVEMVRAAKLALDVMTVAERRRCRFVVLGDTPEDSRPDHLAECRALARELGIAEHVHFLGFRVDVKPYVSDFDVAVVPSVYPDPLPRAVIESMAMGKPVIAFDVGGVSEMLEDKRTGTLVAGSPPDVPSLARELVRYFRDGDLRARQGLRARERVETSFDALGQAKKIQKEIVTAAGLFA